MDAALERFSSDARRLLEDAALWASADGSEAVDTTHLRRALEETPPAGVPASAWTRDAKRVLELSLRGSLRRGATTVDAEDLRAAIGGGSLMSIGGTEPRGAHSSPPPPPSGHDERQNGRTRADPPPLSAFGPQEASPVGLEVGGIRIEGEIHAEPQVAGQPFVVLGVQWAWKAYAIAELEQLGTLARVRRELEVALDVAGIDGVIGATSTGELDGWLILQMPRMAGTLGDHLDGRERGQEKALSAERYGQLLAGVGDTLRGLHRRGIVHRDIKPANLLFDADRARLYICDFSVAKTRRSNLTRTGTALGTDSYIAPEQWRNGESSPASDQYSLGIVAREAFTGRHMPALTRPLADVLRTAAAVDPDDRYPGVDGCRQFGEALVKAIQTEAPTSLADRMRSASAATRFAWAPGLIAAVGYWIKVILDRNPDAIVGLETLLLPIVVGFVAFTVIRLINLPRGRRSQSGAKLLTLWWPPWLIVGAAVWIGGGWHAGWEWYVVLAVPLAFAFAGSYPARCGYWLPALVDRTSRALRDWASLRPLRPVPAQFGAVAAILAVAAFVPLWVADAFPAPYSGPTGVDSAALRAVASFRSALARNDVATACAMVDGRVKTSSPCTRWMRVQVLMARASQERAQHRAHGQPIFDQVPLSQIELVRVGQDASGRTVYSLAYSGASPSETIQTFGDLLVKGSAANVVLTEGPAVTPRQIETQAATYYQLDDQATFWRLRFTDFCSDGGGTVEGVPANQCLSAMRLAPAAVTQLLRHAHK
jgi:tRNA A-37 threonylcarbamoyl transferase component Bud32